MTEDGGQDIGAGLRLARERSGLSLRQIADATKLSVRTLEALESNRIKQLPGGIYRRAIVRVYASEIGLDPETTLRAFVAQHPDDVPSSAPPVAVAADPSPQRLLRTVVSVVGALIPMLAVVSYFTLNARGADQPAHIIDVMPNGAARVALPPASPDSESSSVSMMISVSSRTQLQVTAGGRDVLGRYLEAGEVVRLDLGSDVVLTGDNAGAVHFSINGRAGRTLGAANAPLNVRIARDDYHAWLIQP